MVALARMVAGLLSDAFRLVVLLLRSAGTIRAENLVLRKQLAQYMDQSIKPRRVDFALRVSLALLTRLFDWRDAVVIARAAGDDCLVAQGGLETALAMEVSARATADSSRTADADS